MELYPHTENWNLFFRGSLEISHPQRSGKNDRDSVIPIADGCGLKIQIQKN